MIGRPTDIYLFKVNNRKTRKRCDIYFKVNNKNTRTMSLRSFSCFLINFEHISYLFLVFLLLSLNKEMLAGLLVNL